MTVIADLLNIAIRQGRLLQPANGVQSGWRLSDRELKAP
jgi:hypothetical protein